MLKANYFFPEAEVMEGALLSLVLLNTLFEEEARTREAVVVMK